MSMSYPGYPEGISRFNPYFEDEDEDESEFGEDADDLLDEDDDELKGPVFQKLIDENYDNEE